MKGFGGLEIAGVIALVAVVAVVAVPGVAGTLSSIITGSKNCDIAPFAANCFCPDGYNKVGTPWVEGMIPSFVMTTYVCVDENEQASEQSLAQQKLSVLFPNCDTISCSEPDMSISYGDAGTFYLAECSSPTETGIKVWWGIGINTDGTVWDAHPEYPYCISKDGTYYH